MRISLLHNDRGLAFDNPCFHVLLLVGFQIAFVLRLFAHALHGIHYIALLGQEGVAEISRPLNVVRQAIDHVGQGGEGLDACIPRLFRDSIGQRFVLQVLVLLQPLLELNNFQGIRGSRQNLSEHGIGIKCNRRDERVQLIRRDFRCHLLRGARCLL